MGVKITRHDIGAEIISILTKGMYIDPRDALREYVQNGIDAGAKNIDIKIRGHSIVVADDGHGDLTPNYVPTLIRELSMFFILQSGRRSVAEPGGLQLAAKAAGVI